MHFQPLGMRIHQHYIGTSCLGMGLCDPNEVWSTAELATPTDVTEPSSDCSNSLDNDGSVERLWLYHLAQATTHEWANAFIRFTPW